MRYPCRCNKRKCQARRTLNKHPDDYVRRPSCHVDGCGGLMYLDKYRHRRGAKDHAPACTDPTCPYNSNTGNHNRRHRIDQPGCKYYEDYVRTRNAAPRSKHSPIPADEWVPF